MKKKIFFLFSLITILSVAEYNLYQRYYRAPASDLEAISIDGQETLGFEEYVEKTTPHLTEMGYEASRKPSENTSPLWSEAKSGDIFQAISDPRVLLQLEKRGYRLQDLPT